MRRLALLVALYVTADFSNPLMPGAVNFDDSVEGTTVHRESVARPNPASPRAPSNTDELQAPSELARRESRQAAMPPAFGDRFVQLRRVHAQANELRSPTEDH